MLSEPSCLCLKNGSSSNVLQISQWHCKASCSPDDQVNKTWRDAKCRNWGGRSRITEDYTHKYVSGWLHQCNKHERGQTPGDGKGLGGLACYIVHGVAKSCSWLGNWTTATNMPLRVLSMNSWVHSEHLLSFHLLSFLSSQWKDTFLLPLMKARLFPFPCNRSDPSSHGLP